MACHENATPYICDVCEIGFKRVGTLKNHRKTHIEREKRYKCEMCEKKFIDVAYLQQHKKLHNSDMLFPCPKCEKPFTQDNYLKNHFDTVHAEIKPFVCDICKKQFPMLRNWNKHMKIHEKEPKPKKEGKKFKCDKCVKGFSLRINLIKHGFSHKSKD